MNGLRSLSPAIKRTVVMHQWCPLYSDSASQNSGILSERTFRMPPKLLKSPFSVFRSDYLCYTFFLWENHFFAWASIFLKRDARNKAEIFLSFYLFIFFNCLFGSIYH